MNESHPTTWQFDLDERTTRMSLVATNPNQPPVWATPANIREMVSTFARSEAVPDEVTSILDVSGYLLETAVIHYELAAVAVEKGLQALELMIRYKVGLPPKDGMNRLVETLRKRFKPRLELDEFLKDMVRLRNSWVGHPRGVTAYPMVVAVALLGRIHDAVAELASLTEHPA